MLSHNSASSIQKRRQQHRRQQSLEVPILATPLPTNPRQNPPGTGPQRPGRNQHRRGLSLDQKLSALNSPAPMEFGPPLTQDHSQQLPGSTQPVQIKIEDTNPDCQQPEQHYVQETQQQLPAQPGYQAQDFQAHLQQQLVTGFTSSFDTPSTPQQPRQNQAMQDLARLQNHLRWYQQQYGNSPEPTVQPTPLYQQPIQTVTNEMQGSAYDLMPLQQPQSQTVPNTPQRNMSSWSSPPPAQAKHARSQSYQFDIAPMTNSFEGHQALQADASTYPHLQPPFMADSAALGADQSYASSAYSSSVADPTSPAHQHGSGPMPTLFEEQPLSMPGEPGSEGVLDQGDALLQAAAGASDDFNSPEFVVGGLSPGSEMLLSMGDNVNCSIVDTGIPVDEVEKRISEPDAQKEYYCLHDVDGKICGVKFGRRENARSHVQQHLGDRQFRCNDCGKTFVRQHDMKRHSKTHASERPYICPCSQSFTRQDALTRHRQRGMCAGTLPGFEKAPEDKPKRGRPKKHRPDNETRSAKSKKAREMDRQSSPALPAALPPLAAANPGTGGYAGSASISAPFSEPTAAYYASSSSGLSEHSLPLTPPDNNSVFDADVFLNMGDTPPTSPPGQAPADFFSDAFSSEYGGDVDHDSPFAPCGGDFAPMGKDGFDDFERMGTTISDWLSEN